MKRWLLALFIVFAAAGGAAWWVLHPRESVFLTDADTIRLAATSATVREVLWQAPTSLMDKINGEGDVFEPRSTADGRTLFFVRGKPGANADIYFCTRLGDGWSEPAPLTAVNTKYDELGPAPSADGRSLYFYSDRPGGLGGYDLWISVRDEKNWQAPRNLGAVVNTAFNEYGPSISPDGKMLFFSSNRPKTSEASPNGDAWRATVREDFYRHDYDLYTTAVTESGLKAPTALALLNSAANEGSPTFSPVGDFLYFASDRPGGFGGFDLYRSRWMHGSFGAPENLGATVNTERNELDPSVDLGGFALLFSSDRAVEGKAATYRLYRTESREVFRDVDVRYAQIDWRGLWRRIAPNMMWALLALLATLLLFALLRDMRRRQLSLMARCLLASVLAHALLMFFFNTMRVTATIVSAMKAGGPIRVAMTGSGSGGTIHSQIRGNLSEVSLPQIRMESPRQVAAAIPAGWKPQRSEVSVVGTKRPEGRLLRVRSVEAASSGAMKIPAPAMGPAGIQGPSEVARVDREESVKPLASDADSGKIAHMQAPVATSQRFEAVAVMPTESRGERSTGFGSVSEARDSAPVRGGGSPIAGLLATTSVGAFAIPSEERPISGGDSAAPARPVVRLDTPHVAGLTGGAVEIGDGAAIIAPVGSGGSQGAPIAGLITTTSDSSGPSVGGPTGVFGGTDSLPSIAMTLPTETGQPDGIAGRSESSGLPGVPAGIGELRPAATNIANGFGPPSTVKLDVVSSGSANNGRAGTLFGDPKGVGLVDSSPSKTAGTGSGTGSGTGNAAIDFGLPAELSPPAPRVVEGPVLSQAIGRIIGTVTDAITGEALMGARVQLNVPGEISLEVSTDESGRFAISVSEIPEHFAMSASMRGHLPKSRTGQRRSLRGKALRMNFALDREQANIVAIEEDPVIHHLGNDRFEGSVNSQFQRVAEGDKFFATFDLRADQAPPTCTGAAIEMLAKGVQCPHKIRINGHLLPQRLADSPDDGSFGVQRVDIDAGLLHEGVNTFELKAIACNGDLDDFEFINLQLTLNRPQAPAQ